MEVSDHPFELGSDHLVIYVSDKWKSPKGLHLTHRTVAHVGQLFGVFLVTRGFSSKEHTASVLVAVLGLVIEHAEF